MSCGTSAFLLVGTYSCAAPSAAFTAGDNSTFQLKGRGFHNMGLAHTDFLGSQLTGQVVLHGTLNGKDQVIGPSIHLCQGLNP